MKLVAIKLNTNYERKTRTTVDTIMVTPELLDTWKAPPFQRPVRENDKVRALAEQLKTDGGVWPGIVTLGVLEGKTYIIDGQHRKASFLLSGLNEGYTDIRVHHFTDMAEMGEEFVNLNSQLVKMRPDDILRGLEGSIPELGRIREKCPFVSYEQLRRNVKAPLLSMGATIRAWRNSMGEVPGWSSSVGVTSLARGLKDSQVDDLIEFLAIAERGFGRDPEFYRLWGALNMTLCMWIYRRTVMPQLASGPKRATKLSKDQFCRCLMSLSAHGHYMDWLVGRLMNDRDRSPAYSHIRDIFSRRLRDDMPGTKIAMPQPSWASGKGGRR